MYARQEWILFISIALVYTCVKESLYALVAFLEFLSIASPRFPLVARGCGLRVMELH